jgi:hypothetical protein
VLEVDLDPEELRWDLERLLHHYASTPEPMLGDLDEELHVIEAEDEVPEDADEIPAV